jgi:perilipin-4
MRRLTAIRPPRWQTIAAAAGTALLAAACGSSGTPSSGSSPSTTSAAPSSAAPSSAAPGPTSAVCQDAAALRASINTLTHVQVGQGMGDEIKSDLADVRAKLNTFKAQAHGQWQSQTSALSASLDKLQTAVSNLTSNPSASAVSATVTALRGVSAAAGSLLSAIGTKCPSVSASASPGM